MKRKAIFILAAGLTPLLSMAHPGHGNNGGFTITHYIVEPVHVFTAICLVALSAGSFRYFKRKTKLVK